MSPEKPSPYMMDPRRCVATFGTDRYGKQGAWISIAGEWVRLRSDEVLRLMKKCRQAQQIRLQFEAEMPDSESKIIWTQRKGKKR